MSNLNKNTEIIFVSDIHLNDNDPIVIERFLDFLNEQARKVQMLFILGDLFDVWIGDDDDSILSQKIIQSLASLHRHGTELYFQHGNRDFLIGADFARRSHCMLLGEVHVLHLNDKPTVLMHGDSLCWEDKSYLEFRKKVRHARWQDDVLAHSLKERRIMFAQYRKMSQEQTKLKSQDIIDVSPAAVQKVLTDYNSNLLIHGHTHRPKTHKLSVQNQPSMRIVLGDWHDNQPAQYLRYSNGDYLSETYQ